jgi:hypothetical protein
MSNEKKIKTGVETSFRTTQELRELLERDHDLSTFEENVIRMVHGISLPPEALLEHAGSYERDEVAEHLVKREIDVQRRGYSSHGIKKAKIIAKLKEIYKSR